MTGEESDKLRMDKWLWHARLFKSRTLAGKFVSSAKVRLNEAPVSKAHVTVKTGDVLTFSLHDRVRVLKVLALGHRRGPAPEARALYEDLSPAPAPKTQPSAQSPSREKGQGRPTKADRRALDKWHSQE